jgi:hypothetical protein
MYQQQIIWVVLVLVLYVIYRRFRLTDLEFAVIGFSLLVILTLVRGAREAFTEDEPDVDDGTRKLLTLLELPGYIKAKIGGQLDGMVKDAQETSNTNEDDVVSKESMTEDADVANNGKVDDGKYTLLKREYLVADNMFKKLKETNADVYTRIFGAPADAQQQEEEGGQGDE